MDSENDQEERVGPMDSENDQEESEEMLPPPTTTLIMGKRGDGVCEAEHEECFSKNQASPEAQTSACAAYKECNKKTKKTCD